MQNTLRGNELTSSDTPKNPDGINVRDIRRALDLIVVQPESRQLPANVAIKSFPGGAALNHHVIEAHQIGEI
jgi:hypothetical protein